MKIIYEDRDIIVVNKPAGMPTQASEVKKCEDLFSSLQNHLNDRKGKEVYLALHHRLDAATSGLVLFCKNKIYNKFVTDLFREKKILKKYIAVVDVNSPIEETEWTVENKIIEYRYKHFKKAKTSKSGKSAVTEFKVLKEFDGKALIECTPRTGRLHQIRVHLADMGLPIVGDFHYNKVYKGKEFQLCAHYMGFRHPRTRKLIECQIDSPFYPS